MSDQSLSGLIIAAKEAREATAALMRSIKDAKTLDDVMIHPELAKFNGFGVRLQDAIIKAESELK